MNTDKLKLLMNERMHCPHSKSGKINPAGCILCAKETKKNMEKEDRERLKIYQEEKKKNKIKTAFKHSGLSAKALTRYFENYKTYDARQTERIDICKQYALNFGDAMQAGSSLLLIGNPGTGKNHLMYAIANHVLNSGYKVLFTKATYFLRQIKATYNKSYSGPNEQQIINNLLKPDLLLLDEIGNQGGTGFEERIIFEVIDGRNEEFKPIIMASNCLLNEITNVIGNRSFDRLKENAKVLDFPWSSYRSKVAGDPNLPVNKVAK